MYVHDIKVGTTVLDGKPEVINETSATALVEGNNLLGPVSVIFIRRGLYSHEFKCKHRTLIVDVCIYNFGYILL